MLFSLATNFSTSFLVIARQKMTPGIGGKPSNSTWRKKSVKLVKIRRHIAYFRDSFGSIRAGYHYDNVL